MCLFLQNQDFQLHTEFMLDSLYAGGREAASRLLLVNISISQQVVRSAQLYACNSRLERAHLAAISSCSISYLLTVST